ncbi:DUF3829 domain-containing protein [Pseudomonas sp. St316]|uniref:DUF3829 domain-containing protein n=1 Tax=Pseudomonas sp. St316 TaxID=2678257 RepID=UPI001BB2F041|nr:DUF3829 domain-containing protein [Pseudomonas sp. St316]BBP59809.1 hypothetical protein PHLH4_33990 [Pseudomonas sp. St316]
MISTRAFITAVVVLLTMTWLVQRLAGPTNDDKENRAHWAEVQEISTCLVDGAELLEQRYVDYRARQALPEEEWIRRMGFIGFGMGSGIDAEEFIRPQGSSPSPCKHGFSSGEPGSLQALARNYIKAYDDLRPIAQTAELWLNNHRDQPQPGELEKLDRALTLHLQDARAQAIPLRQALEQPQLQVREQQLASIEKHQGQDQHWYTLRFMILARQTINALDTMTEDAPLTPQQLLDLHHSLATHWTDTEAFVQALPRLRSANDSPPVWNKISLAAKEWLAALERLQQHWASGDDAAELNQDLAAARAGYDELRMRYNAAVQLQY